MTDYYSAHYRSYDAQTFHIDPEPFLGRFARWLRAGCRVLDVGCGSGRDLLWLQRRGFDVVGFERSPGLAGLAADRAGCPVIRGDFEHFDFSTLSVHAVVMCGCLVHLPHRRLQRVLASILRSIQTDRLPAGSADPLAYLSVKEGAGRMTDARGRVFYLWQNRDLQDLFAAGGLEVVDFSRRPAADGGGATWLGYVLRKLDRSADRPGSNHMEKHPAA